MSHTFLPWLREGLGAVADSDVGIRLLVNDTEMDPLPVRLLGPGDVLDVDQAEIVRSEPPTGAQATEPNYFPHVEFDRPSFPWLFTPGGPDDRGRLRPWLVLVVLPRERGLSVDTDPVTRRRALTVEAPLRVRDELPDLAES